MRIIKFRAIGKLMKGNDVGERHKLFFTLDDLMRGQPNFAYPEHFDFNEWTGLLDKNGKEIYEGDICTQTFGSEPQEKGAVTIGITTGVMVGNRPVWHHNVEIIGNIYENPNLIN